MSDRIKLTDDNFSIQSVDHYGDENYLGITIKHFDSYSDKAHQLQQQILHDNVKVPKLESKLKMMEISFEQINNSRNDLIKELTECEMLNKELKEKLVKEK